MSLVFSVNTLSLNHPGSQRGEVKSKPRLSSQKPELPSITVGERERNIEDHSFPLTDGKCGLGWELGMAQVAWLSKDRSGDSNTAPCSQPSVHNLSLLPPPLARLSSCCAICPFLWQRHTPHLKGLWLPQVRDINDPGRGLERFHFRLTEVASLEARVSLLEIDPLLQKECNFRKKKCPVQFSNLQSANLLAYSRAQSGFSEFLGWKGGGMAGRCRDGLGTGSRQ